MIEIVNPCYVMYGAKKSGFWTNCPPFRAQQHDGLVTSWTLDCMIHDIGQKNLSQAIDG